MINTRTHVAVTSTDGQFKTPLSSFVIITISDDLPARSFRIEVWKTPKKVTLADPQFMQSGKNDF